MQRGRSRDIGPDSRSDALCAAIVGNRGKPSGESRLRGRAVIGRAAPGHSAAWSREGSGQTVKSLCDRGS